MEKSRVTEIKVRIDCNGCVQKIKKALHGVEGIEEVDVDLQLQKITITGSADPEALVKAIKKTRKTAVICLHEEVTCDDQEKAPPSEGADLPVNPPEELPQKEATQKNESPPPPPTPLQRVKVASPESGTSEPNPSPGAEEIQMIPQQQPPEVGFRDRLNPEYQHGGANWGGAYDFRERVSQRIYVAHGYSTHRASTYVTEYANPGYFGPAYATPRDTVRPQTTQVEFEKPVSSYPVYPQRKQGPPPSVTQTSYPVHSHSVQPQKKQGAPLPVTETSNPVQSQPVSALKKQGPPSSEGENPVPPQAVYGSYAQRKYFSATAPTHQASSSHPVYATHNNEFTPSPSVSEFATPASALPNYANAYRARQPEKVHQNTPQSDMFRHRGESMKLNSDQTIYMTSHNVFRPIPPVTENAFPPLYSSAECHTSQLPFTEYLQQPARRVCIGFEKDDDDDYFGSSNGNITSVFSEENPNSCRIS